MKNKLLAANWKSNKVKNEARQWFDEFSKNAWENGSEVVLLLPFTLLEFGSSYIKEKNLNIKLGAQNVSPYDNGAYTGEVNAEQIKEFADYVLIGHSERRKNFSETDDAVNKKIERTIASSLTPIVCVSNMHQVESINRDDLIIAYEPIEAIGTGDPDDPQNTLSVAREVKERMKNAKVIYGGSVKAENVRNYTALDGVEGVLVGSESLSASSFSEIIKNAV